MRRRIGVGLALLVLLHLVPARSQAQTLDAPPIADPIGYVCVAPLERDPEFSPGSQYDGKSEFYVSVDHGPKMMIPRQEAGVMLTLDLENRHLIEAFDAKGRIDSFYFTFQKRGSNRLCLFLNPYYMSWHLEPLDKRHQWCKCSQA